jgi:hypothetical protein
VIFNEDDVGRAATDGFDADRAGSSEEVEEAGTFYARTEDVEESFAQHVAGGANLEILERPQVAGAKLSGDDAHGQAILLI